MTTHSDLNILESPPNSYSNVFLMIRFRDSEQYETINEAISSILAEYSLKLIRADWKQYHDELWANVKYCMDTSLYGIAVFEQMNEAYISPNVSLELGYMLAKNKRCLLLKERQVPVLQADLIGFLCREFDSDKLNETVRAAVRSWLRDLGIAKRADEQLLVYVSMGGTCRCAMAKAITRKLLQQKPSGYNLRVESMARAHPGLPGASYNARRTMYKMYGEDLLQDHRTAILTPTIIKEANLILVMDNLLAKALPAEKTFVLKPYFGLKGDIADPWPDGQDEVAANRYMRCGMQLREILEANIDTIIENLRPQSSESAHERGG